MAWGKTYIVSCFNFQRRTAESDLRNSGITRHFKYKELYKATKNFEKKLGEGGYGIVYRGVLDDEREVAVKKILNPDKKQREQFMEEVKLLSGICHQNLITLYGFTNEDNHLFLVYEFVPNGTVYEHLHDKGEPFACQVRVQIAKETAEALSYLHSRDPQIVHRDVKPQNILLGHDFSVKVADFGLCRLLPKDKQVTTLTPGTVGYQDPEYRRLIKLTDKSDVYSFGVFLMELITRKKALDFDQISGEPVYLQDIIAVNEFIKDKLKELIDSGLEYESNSDVKMTVDCAAELALKCLQEKGRERPPMAKVLEALNSIRSRLSERLDVDNENGKRYGKNWSRD